MLIHKKNKIIPMRGKVLKGGAIIRHQIDDRVNNPIYGKPIPNNYPLISGNVVGGKLDFNKSKKRQNLRFVA